MKKVFKAALLFSVLAASLLSCSHLFEDDEPISSGRNSGDSGGGGVTSNDATGSAPERVVENKTGRTPQIGDKLFKNNNKGFVIEKTNTDHDNDSEWDLLGYIYKVDGDIIKVVSQDTGDAKWARQSGAVYNSTGFTNPRLSEKLSSVTDGYTAWRTVGGKLKIKDDKVVNENDESVVTNKDDVHEAWNPNALFRNYDAISWALCYPSSNKTGSELPSSHPLRAAGSTNVLTWLENANFSGEGAKPFTKEVVQVIAGNTVESRWYLPSVAELKQIYSAGLQLGNWESKLKDQKFWSVEVNTYPGDYNAENEKKAKYVDFATSGDDAGQDKTEDKQTQYKALSVAQFNYKNM